MAASGTRVGRPGVLAVVFLLAVSLLVAVPSVHTAGPAPAVGAIQAVPANQAPTSAPALVTDSTGLVYAFYRGQDTAAWQRTLRDGVWSGQTSIGGKIIGAPSATLAGTGFVVAGRGTDSALWIRTRQGATWGPWQSLGGVLSGAPVVVGSADGTIDVFGRGTDDALWTRTRPPAGSWSPWTRLGGTLTTGPSAVSLGSGRVDVYVAGTDEAVWRRTRSAGGWSAWHSLGGRTYVAPAAAAAPQGGEAWVFARGTDNALFVNTSTAGGWTGWRRLGGVLIDAPAAAGTTGRVDVVVRGTDNALWLRMYRNGAWSGWLRAWSPAVPSPPPSSRLGVDWTRIPTTSRVVALTFDAGANADALPSIRRTLQGKNVPATFFLTGQWVRAFPAEANEIAVGGFLVGNHSDTHPEFTTLSDAQIRAELANGQRAILLANGAESRPLFRFPFGDVDGRVLSTVNNAGYVGVRWTVDTLGWQGTSSGMTAQRVIDRVLAGLQPGEIVLMHVGSHPTDRSTLDADALPRVIDALRARGYSFVTLSALIGG